MRTDRRWKLIILPLALVAVSLHLLASSVFMEVSTVMTFGEEPAITKTGTLTINNEEGGTIENARAALQESDEGYYTIVDGLVEFPSVDAGASLESTDTFSVTVDTSGEHSRSVGTRWLLDFDLGGEHHQVLLHLVLDVPEMDE